LCALSASAAPAAASVTIGETFAPTQVCGANVKFGRDRFPRRSQSPSTPRQYAGDLSPKKCKKGQKLKTGKCKKKKKKTPRLFRGDRR
jgi:hypothetical protein